MKTVISFFSILLFVALLGIYSIPNKSSATLNVYEVTGNCQINGYTPLANSYVEVSLNGVVVGTAYSDNYTFFRVPHLEPGVYYTVRVSKNGCFWTKKKVLCSTIDFRNVPMVCE